MTVVIDTPVQSSGHFGRLSTATATRVNRTSTQEFLGVVLGGPKRFHYLSRDERYVVEEPTEGYQGQIYDAAAYGGGADDVRAVSLGIQAIHQAFAAHVALSLSPDSLWYMIVHEVAAHVRQNATRYAGIFTETPGSKQTISIRDDSLRYDEPSDWQHSISLIRNPLRAKVSDYTMDLFLPRFTTTTDEDETALLVAFMDVASPYYGFEWRTCCGIPQVRLEGEAADWQSLHFRTDQLAREFDGLSDYFADLLPVLQMIAETASGATPNEEFWRSIYKYGGGSGGPYVNGWITAFFAHVLAYDGLRPKEHFDWLGESKGAFGGFTTDQFPSHISKVPFVWDYMGKKIDMAFAAGVTGVDYDDTFLSPRLGFAVIEV
jgi:hypothetical protein